MNQQTASRLVLFFVLGGVVLGLWTGKGAEGKYRKVWGVTLMGLGGAALADFAPAIVGPYFLLVIVAYAAGHYGQLGGIGRQLQTSAGTAPKGGPSTGRKK